MSTPNFKTMKDFPLIIGEETYCKYCPECGLSVDSDATKCEDCGADLTEVAAVYDELAMEDTIAEMKAICKKLNDNLHFYELTVESGYYTGVQFYVNESYYNPQDMDNEECRYQFDMCRSKALRKMNTERNKIVRALRKAKKDYGFTELVCCGIFSNGEAVYSRVA